MKSLGQKPCQPERRGHECGKNQPKLRSRVGPDDLQLGFYLGNVPLKFDSCFKPCYSSLKPIRLGRAAQVSVGERQTRSVDRLLDRG